jgi:hypothetical protein
LTEIKPRKIDRRRRLERIGGRGTHQPTTVARVCFWGESKMSREASEIRLAGNNLDKARDIQPQSSIARASD